MNDDRGKRPARPAKSAVGTFVLAALVLLGGLVALNYMIPRHDVAGASRWEATELRHEVPLVRPLHNDSPGQTLDVDFYLPAPGRNASNHLLIGLRVVARDVEPMLAVVDRIARGRAPAKVRLWRIINGVDVPVALISNTPDLDSRVPVPESGLVPGLTSSDVDSTLLVDAGLLQPQVFYYVLMLAVAEKAEPGDYRLAVELPAEHLQLGAERAELLVAYSGKGK